MKQTDLGVFIHRIAYSESSLITTFYTKNNGLQKFVFQGGKKKNSNLFPLNVCELDFYFRPDSELGKLTKADSITNLDSIFSSPIKSVIAFFIADVLRQTLQTNQKELKVFSFLTRSITELNATEDTANFPLVFLVNYTNCIGIQPDFNEEKPTYFSLKDGEFHADYRIGEWCIEGGLVEQLYILFKENKINPLFRKQALETVLNYYSLHVPRFNVDKLLDIIREVLN